MLLRTSDVFAKKSIERRPSVSVERWWCISKSTFPNECQTSRNSRKQQWCCLRPFLDSWLTQQSTSMILRLDKMEVLVTIVLQHTGWLLQNKFPITKIRGLRGPFIFAMRTIVHGKMVFISKQTRACHRHHIEKLSLMINQKIMLLFTEYIVFEYNTIFNSIRNDERETLFRLWTQKRNSTT